MLQSGELGMHIKTRTAASHRDTKTSTNELDWRLMKELLF